MVFAAALGQRPLTPGRYPDSRAETLSGLERVAFPGFRAQWLAVLYRYTAAVTRLRSHTVAGAVGASNPVPV